MMHLEAFGFLNFRPFSDVGNGVFCGVQDGCRRGKWGFSGPFGMENRVGGCAWRKLRFCCLKWLLLALHSVWFPPYSASMMATAARVRVLTAIFMGVFGNSLQGGEETLGRIGKNEISSKY